MQREKIKPATNVPLIVELEETNGYESHSQYTGLEFRYDVLHANVACHLYLKPEAVQALTRVGARAGDTVEIVKRLSKGVETYSVRIFSDATLAVPALPATPAQPDPFGVRMLAPRSQVAPQALPPPAPAAQPPHRSTVAQQAAAAPTPDAVLVAQCGMAVVDAAMGIEAYAKGKNFPLQFEPEDIRAMILTLVINAQRRGY